EVHLLHQRGAKRGGLQSDPREVPPGVAGTADRRRCGGHAEHHAGVIGSRRDTGWIERFSPLSRQAVSPTSEFARIVAMAFLAGGRHRADDFRRPGAATVTTSRTDPGAGPTGTRQSAQFLSL